MVTTQPTEYETSMIEATKAISNNFSFQSATSYLDEFDGKNRPLRDFIQDIEGGDSLVPGGLKNNYLKFVLSKLRGRARDSLANKKIEKLQDVIDNLKTHFAPAKSYANYVKEIQALRIKKDETVSEFYTRLLRKVELAKTALITKYKEAADTLTPQLEEIALSAFKDGMSDRMSYALIILDGLDTLEKAYKKAKIIEDASKHNNDSDLSPSDAHILAIQSKFPPRVEFEQNGRTTPTHFSENYSNNQSKYNSNNSPSGRSHSPFSYQNSNYSAQNSHKDNNSHYSQYLYPPMPYGYFPYPPPIPYFMPPYPMYPPQMPPDYQQYYQQFSNQPRTAQTADNKEESGRKTPDMFAKESAPIAQALNSKTILRSDAARNPNPSTRQNQEKFLAYLQQNHAEK